MKKILLLALFFIVSVFMVACGNVTETEIDSTSESSASAEQSDNAEEAVEEEVEQVVEEVVVDDEKVTITYKGITIKEDDIFGDEANIKFFIENKLDHAVMVQTRDFSVDGIMVDESTVAFSQDIAGGKSANASIDIYNFEDTDFPEFKENVEMRLIVIDEDSWDEIASYPITISVN